MPRKAAVVPLDDWLPPCLVSVHPECEVLVAPRYFDVNVAEWRALCRRMLRSGLGKKVSSNVYLLLISGGAFSFPITLTETGSSVTANLGMVQNDSLESVIGLHDSDVSCDQVVVSSEKSP